MNDALDVRDTLEPLGIGVGVLLVLVGLATVAGQPWTVKSGFDAGVQIVGALGTAAVGVLLVWLSRTE